MATTYPNNNDRFDIIQRKIQALSEQIGNKSANLLELQDMCQQAEKVLNDGSDSPSDEIYKIQVPALCPLTHEAILKHLTAHAPKWQELWEKFKTEQGKETKHLTKEALVTLEKLQALIIEVFEKTPLKANELESFIKSFQDKEKDSLLMVRSTGKEDTVDFANPGGNESVAAVKLDAQSISNAVGIVIACYFSPKSLSQRLISKDDILKDPFMPVLLQKMIGEPLQGNPDKTAIVSSGVMYSSKGITRLQMAPGHGELIVNSKAPFDTFLVTNENIVHSEISHKQIRLIPIEVEENSQIKRKLVYQTNPKEIRDVPSVPENVALQIAKLGRIIEKHYGIPMDVEFIYDPASKVISLAQARPIPKGDLRRVIPSSIPPEKLSEVRKMGICYKGATITPAGSAANVITKPEEILICNDIATALNLYLNQKNSVVKAVIIKQTAPLTSHEAAQFNAKAIPVLQMSDIKMIEAWVAEPKPVLIIDPQRQQVVNWSSQIKNHAEAYQEIKAAGIIQEGLFKSAMPAQKTILPILSDNTKARLAKSSVTIKPFGSKQSPDLIGDLIQKVNTAKTETDLEKSATELMKALFVPLSSSSLGGVSVNPKKIFSELLTELEKMEAVVSKTTNEGKKIFSKNIIRVL